VELRAHAAEREAAWRRDERDMQELARRRQHGEMALVL